jgi:AcrR family transcriptional regulator
MRTGSPRRRSAELTRQRLLEAGRAAFAARGHDGVNLQRDILGPASVSVGSFYHQFDDKTDLLVAVLEDAAERGRAVIAEVADRVPDDPAAAARSSFERWFAIVDTGEDIIRIQLQERENPDERIRALLARLRQGWLDSLTASYRRFAGEGSSFDPRQAARVVLALGLGVLIVYLDAPPEARPALRKEWLDALVPFTVGGFAALGATESDGT